MTKTQIAGGAVATVLVLIALAAADRALQPDKDENPWVAHVPRERRPKESYPIELFGMTIVRRERPIDLRRLFMARFGDIVRPEYLPWADVELVEIDRP